MRLHYHPLSSYSRKVRSAMLIRGDAHDTHIIDAFQGELESPAHVAISPFGKMPVLVTDDEGPVFESTSIIEYLESRGPRVLLPEGSERVARHWDRVADLYLMEPVGAYWWRPTSEEGKEAPGVARKAWGLFEQRLEGRAFVAGKEFSLGDLAAAIATDYLVRLGLEPPKRVREWLARCYELPGMKQSLDEAGPYIGAGLSMREKRMA